MIIYKTDKEIKAIKKSNQIVAKILRELQSMVKPGIKTEELDSYAEARTKEMKAVPAFKGYHGYPASLCASVNEEIVHGIPGSRILREGDIISLDFGVVYDGFYGDAALTCPVGRISKEAQKLISAVEEAFHRGLEQVREGNRISDVSFAIQRNVESKGFSVIRSFVGHGIGFYLHEEPQIPNFGSAGHGLRIKKGMVLAIEPMISSGDWRVEILPNEWTAITKDRTLSAHYEHTVAVTSSGVEILSLLESNSVKESNYA